MSDVIKFPYSAARRVHARKPRRSKNGAPEERAAKAAAAAAGLSSAMSRTCRCAVASTSRRSGARFAALLEQIEPRNYPGLLARMR